MNDKILCLILDISYSKDSKNIDGRIKVNAMMKSIKSFLSSTDNIDVHVVVFNSNAYKVDVDQIKNGQYMFELNPVKNMAEALKLAFDILVDLGHNKQKQVILISNGYPFCQDSAMNTVVVYFCKHGIKINTITFGDDESFLRRIAKETGGLGGGAKSIQELSERISEYCNK